MGRIENGSYYARRRTRRKRRGAIAVDAYQEVLPVVAAKRRIGLESGATANSARIVDLVAPRRSIDAGTMQVPWWL